MLNIFATVINTAAVGVTSPSTFDGSVARSIYSPTQLVNANSSPTFAGLSITGNTTLGDNALSDTLNVNAITTVAGAVTLQNTLTVGGNTTIGTTAAPRTLTVRGATTLGYYSPTAASVINVHTVYGELDILHDHMVTSGSYSDIHIADGRIYFGSVADGVYIERTSSGLHFSAGIYSDDFITAGASS